MRKGVVLLVAIVAMLSSCSEKKIWWDDDEAWVKDSINEEQVDVFYIVSTSIGHSENADGTTAYNAVLTDAERAALCREAAYIKQNFADSFNMFSPIYHQCTVEGFVHNNRDSVVKFREQSERECCEAFDYYMSHFNNGRQFILAGFSQGAMNVVALLKHMTDEQYSRCKAAYVMGYRLSSEDMKHKHIEAANGEIEGKVVSFNTVAATDGILGLTAGKAATCINPMNWKNDSTAATRWVVYDGEIDHYAIYDSSFAENIESGDTIYINVKLDEQRNVLTASAPMLPLSYVFNLPAFGLKDNKNLHLADLFFYLPRLRENAIKRAYK
ncbi:MAG: DUF3089 domain-containing protein [Paludibacteraceae bacterium]|nr:DUF3089 domain-containing protein [Paludibacteraceae bacterium]